MIAEKFLLEKEAILI